MELAALSRVTASLGADRESPCCKQVWHNLWLAFAMVSDLKSSASCPPSLLSPSCIHPHDVFCDARHLEAFARVARYQGTMLLEF